LGQSDQPDRKHEHAHHQGCLFGDVHGRVLGTPTDLSGEVIVRGHQQGADVLSETVGEACGQQADADDDLDGSRQRDSIGHVRGKGGRGQV
jgi:hypothetical protein